MIPFSEPVAQWFTSSLGQPTPVQLEGWPKLLSGESALLIAPTGSGKTLAAFLAALNRLMFGPIPNGPGVRVLYVSPLKALAVDVQRNLQVPLAGIEQAALKLGCPVRVPSIVLRSGDTPALERARFRRKASDILITTPESLYLLLTSDAAKHLAAVETVIVDEVHSMVATKRGAHLTVSLERLQALRGGSPLQRIGLSATVQPASVAANWLGGADASQTGAPPRPVAIVNAGGLPRLQLRVEMPVQELDRSQLPADQRSIWPAIHRPLLQLIKSHRSTLIFVNNRGLAERLSADLNEACGELLVLAHHGAVARERRLQIEEQLKSGQLRGLVATSTLELGIDMGAIDLVVQIEAPPSIASGLQRMGRAGHQVGGQSVGVIYPKFKGDLLAAAAATERMLKGQVEELRFPRNPLDVMAQQIVAIVSMGPVHRGALLQLIRGAAPFAQVTDESFDGVLDMLSGRYPSDAFAELRPRINWDRNTGVLTPRQGARHLSVVNGGTIPDRGLYGVFLATNAEGQRSRRVGELDEEMVFESRIGDVFLLGASSWRIEDITPDRVLVSPAPGEPGRMPFWHGDRQGRPLALGRAVGQLAQSLDSSDDTVAQASLTQRGLAPSAATTLVSYLRAQRKATGSLPTDRQIVVESFYDEVGDYRVCVLSPFGSRVHAPWAIAAMQQQRQQLAAETKAIWFDDGIVFQFPKAKPPELSVLIPDPLELDELLLQGLFASPLFASVFRESSARALLLPRRAPGRRMPLWVQRKRALDLLQAASRFHDFPMVLETVRECLSQVFDVEGLREVLSAIRRREIHVSRVESERPSPFSAALLFNYAGNFIYLGDAPLAERRAQALTINQSQLRELLGEAELRNLLHPDAIREVIEDVSRRKLRLRNADDVHDLLLRVGDLLPDDLFNWNQEPEAAVQVAEWLDELAQQQRVIPVPIHGQVRFIAAEDAGRYRALGGFRVPSRFPKALLEPVAEPLSDLVARYARTHGPFDIQALNRRYPVSEEQTLTILRQLEQRGRVVCGYFLPQGSGLEWCDADVLRRIKQLSLKHLRAQVQSVSGDALARFLAEWQGAVQPRRGGDVLAGVLDQLKGMPLIASVLESDILPARVEPYHPSALDELILSGEFVWRGWSSLGQSDGRIAIYPRESYALLAPSVQSAPGELCEQIRQILRQRGASFFEELVAGTAGFAPDVLEALWDLIWAGEVTNDSLVPLRSRLSRSQAVQRHPLRARARRQRLPGSEGRFSLLERWIPVPGPTPTARLAAIAQSLLDRYGVLPSEACGHEQNITFSEVYPVLKALEEGGKIRRGYFVEGLGALQFAEPGADERLRLLREPRGSAEPVILAATDPAQPYGSLLPWPENNQRLQRAAGARVILHQGSLVGYLSRNEHCLSIFQPADPEQQCTVEAAVAGALVKWVEARRMRTLHLQEINGEPAKRSASASALQQAGFAAVSDGLFLRVNPV